MKRVLAVRCAGSRVFTYSSVYTKYVRQYSTESSNPWDNLTSGRREVNWDTSTPKWKEEVPEWTETPFQTQPYPDPEIDDIYEHVDIPGITSPIVDPDRLQKINAQWSALPDYLWKIEEAKQIHYRGHLPESQQNPLPLFVNAPITSKPAPKAAPPAAESTKPKIVPSEHVRKIEQQIEQRRASRVKEFYIED